MQHLLMPLFTKRSAKYRLSSLYKTFSNHVRHPQLSLVVCAAVKHSARSCKNIRVPCSIGAANQLGAHMYLQTPFHTSHVTFACLYFPPLLSPP